jgi:hypothetical protein
MDETHISKLKDWITLDDQTLELKNSINALNEKKKEVEDEIMKYVEDKKLEDVTITFGDRKLKFAKTNVKQTLSIKYIKTALAKYNDELPNNNKIDIDDLCKYLLENLETSTKVCIKRPIR